MEDCRRRNIIIAIGVAAEQNLLRSVIEKLHHEESSDDEYDHTNIEVNILEARIRTRSDLRNATRVKGYVDTIIPNYSGKQFREHFRMSRTTFENLERILTPHLIRTAESGRCTLNVRTQLLAVLWLLATPDSFRSVLDRFDISKSMLYHSMKRVVIVLNNLADRFIKWPVGDRLVEVKHRFSEIGSFPGVIGVIDGSHIPIPAPKVCDANLIFIDCFVGFPGSVHDARVFRNSDLWHAITANKNAFFPQNEFIIGDNAYPMLARCLAPYIMNRGNLTEVQKNFNELLSKTRQVIERAFALLKGRFRRLKYLDMSCADLIPYVILACCVLHNICLEGCDDDVDDFICDGMDSNVDDNDNVNNIIPDPLPNDERELTHREYIAALVAHVAS